MGPRFRTWHTCGYDLERSAERLVIPCYFDAGLVLKLGISFSTGGQDANDSQEEPYPVFDAA